MGVFTSAVITVGLVFLMAVSKVASTSEGPAVDSDGVIKEYCMGCHDDRRMRGNLSLEDFRALDAGRTPEKMIRKLRAGMMPPRVRSAREAIPSCS